MAMPLFYTESPVSYLLLLQPRKEVSDAIMQIKKELAQTYKATQALNSRPHIAMVHFTQYAGCEARICQYLQNIANAQAPIMVDLQGFGSLPTHTLYIPVVSCMAIQALVKNIRTQMQPLLRLDKDNTPLFIVAPHITIARKLLPWQYEKAWQEYSHRHFSARFIASHMVLLKKNEGDEKMECLRQFDFVNVKAAVKQSSLF